MMDAQNGLFRGNTSAKSFLLFSIVTLLPVALCVTGCMSTSTPPAAPAATPLDTQSMPVAATAQPGKEEAAAHSAASPAATTLPAATTTSAGAAAANLSAAAFEIANLKTEVMSLKEKIATLQRKFEVILKGQRSGIYDDVNVTAAVSLAQQANSKKNPIPPLTSEGPLDRFESDSSQEQREKSLTPEKPQQLVERAIMLLEQQEFGKVAQALENFQQRFPNSALSPIAEMTLAEAYIELKSPQQAMTHIRTFYLQHPNDTQMIRAKWLEARAQELMSAPQKAAQLFREVIALDPQSQFALRAQSALEKLSGGTPQ